MESTNRSSPNALRADLSEELSKLGGKLLATSDLELSWLHLSSANISGALSVLSPIQDGSIPAEFSPNSRVSSNISLRWCASSFISRLTSHPPKFSPEMPILVLQQVDLHFFILVQSAPQLKMLSVKQIQSAIASIRNLPQPLLDSLVPQIQPLIALIPPSDLFSEFGIGAICLYSIPPISFISSSPIRTIDFKDCFANFGSTAASLLIQSRIVNSFSFPTRFPSLPDGDIISLLNNSLTMSNHFVDILFSEFKKTYDLCCLNYAPPNIIPWFYCASVRSFAGNYSLLSAAISSIDPGGICSEFLIRIRSDLEILRKVRQFLGKKLSSKDLACVSIPRLFYKCVSLTEIQYLLTKQFFHITDKMRNEDFFFVTAAITIESFLMILESKDEDTKDKYYDSLLMNLTSIHDDKTKDSICIDLFSILFLKNGDTFVTSYNDALRLLNILIRVCKFREIQKAHYLCAMGGATDLRGLMLGPHTAFAQALSGKNWEIAELYAQEEPSFKKWLEMAMAVQNPNDKNGMNRDLSVELSFCNGVPIKAISSDNPLTAELIKKKESQKTCAMDAVRIAAKFTEGRAIIVDDNVLRGISVYQRFSFFVQLTSIFGGYDDQDLLSSIFLAIESDYGQKLLSIVPAEDIFPICVKREKDSSSPKFMKLFCPIFPIECAAIYSDHRDPKSIFESYYGKGALYYYLNRVEEKPGYCIESLLVDKRTSESDIEDAFYSSDWDEVMKFVESHSSVVLMERAFLIVDELLSKFPDQKLLTDISILKPFGAEKALSIDDCLKKESIEKIRIQYPETTEYDKFIKRFFPVDNYSIVTERKVEEPKIFAASSFILPPLSLLSDLPSIIESSATSYISTLSVTSITEEKKVASMLYSILMLRISKQFCEKITILQEFVHTISFLRYQLCYALAFFPTQEFAHPLASICFDRDMYTLGIKICSCFGVPLSYFSSKYLQLGFCLSIEKVSHFWAPHSSISIDSLIHYVFFPPDFDATFILALSSSPVELLRTGQIQEYNHMQRLRICIRHKLEEESRPEELIYYATNFVRPLGRSISLLVRYGAFEHAFTQLCSIANQEDMVESFIKDFIITSASFQKLEEIKKFLLSQDPGLSFTLALWSGLLEKFQQKGMIKSRFILLSYLNWSEDAAKAAIQIFNETTTISKAIPIITEAESLLFESLWIRTGQQSPQEGYPFRPSDMQEEQLKRFVQLIGAQKQVCQYIVQHPEAGVYGFNVIECEKSAFGVTVMLCLEGVFEMAEVIIDYYQFSNSSVTEAAIQKAVELDLDSITKFLRKAKMKSSFFDLSYKLILHRLSESPKGRPMVPQLIFIFTEDFQVQCLVLLELRFIKEAWDVSTKHSIRNAIPLIAKYASDLGDSAVVGLCAAASQTVLQ